MKFTIRIKVLIGFALLLLLSSFIQAFSFSITTNYIMSQINSSQSIEAQKGAQEIQNFFIDLNEITYGLARNYRDNNNSASSSAQNDISSITKYIVNNHDYIRKVTYLTNTGRELHMFDEHGQVSQDQLSYEVFTDTFKSAASGKTAISKVYYTERELGPHIDIFSPIFDKDHNVNGVLKMQTSLETLRKSLENIKYGDTGFMYLVDDEGRLIAHPSQEYVFNRPDLSSRKIINLTLQNQTPTQDDYFYTNEKNVQVIAKAKKIPGINWVAVIEEPVSEAFGFLNFIRDTFIVTLIGSTFFLLLVALFITENITSPIRKLQKSVGLIEKGEIRSITDLGSGDEIEALSRSFNSMVGKLMQREDSIKNENQEMTTLLQSLTDAVIGLDAKNNIYVFNKAAENITKLSAQNVINCHVDDILEFYDEHDRITFQNISVQTETMIQKLRTKGLLLKLSNGDIVSVSLQISPILFDDKQTGYIITFHDTSKEHELEEMKLDFVSMAAHELRTPLTAIRGYTSLFQMQYNKQLDDNGQEIIKRLIISSENLSNLIDNLLSVSRIERNSFFVEARPVNLTNLLRNVADTMKYQLVTRQQNLVINIAKDLPIVMADTFRISQVIINLISNASNFSGDGGIITISARKNYNDLEISVEDNGQGIPKEALPKLFTKFFRVSGTLEQGSKGTGLGLFIAKSIIDMHKGKIWVESEYGKGSKFTFSLPSATAEDITNYRQKAENASLTVKNGSRIIMKKLNSVN